MDFSFLKNLDQVLVETPKAKKEKVVYPIEGDFRVKANGTILFTPEFEKRIGSKVTSEGIITKWLDVVFSDEWHQYPKDAPKVCLMVINDQDKPLKADIKAQGKITYIQEQFIPKAEVFWDISFEERGFIDFKVETEGAPIKIALIPKVVARGELKGSPDYARRENIIMYPVIPNLDDVEVVMEEKEEGDNNRTEVRDTKENLVPSAKGGK